jgi:hypothetical protein
MQVTMMPKQPSIHKVRLIVHRKILMARLAKSQTLLLLTHFLLKIKFKRLII